MIECLTLREGHPQEGLQAVCWAEVRILRCVFCQGTSEAQQTPPSVHNLDAQVHLGRKNALRVPTEGPTAWGRQNVPVGGCTGTVRAGEQLSKPQGLLLGAK